MASIGAVSKKEIQRRNCLTLIVKDCNLYYSASEVLATLKQLTDDKNVVNTYFKDGDVEKNQHARVCNLEVLNPTIYKQYVKTTTKILNKYVTFHPHPRSLDGTSAPHEDVLKEFDFLDVKNAIVGAMTAIANQATSSQPFGMSFAIVTEMIKASTEQTKMEIRKDLEVMQIKVTVDAHTYADIIVGDLKLTLDTKFQAILDSVESTRSLLLAGTPSRKTNMFSTLRDCQGSYLAIQILCYYFYVLCTCSAYFVYDFLHYQ